MPESKQDKKVKEEAKRLCRSVTRVKSLARLAGILLALGG